MNLTKLFYSKRSMKRKILDIKEDIEKLVSKYCKEKFWIDWYGAYDIDPKHLVFWVCVQTDKMKLALKSNFELINGLGNLLVKHSYAEQARQSVFIDFELQETVDKESNGSWYQHFK